MTATKTHDGAGARLLALLAAAALALALLPTLAGPAEAAHPANATERLFGENRFSTAAEIALESFDEGADTVVLARGDVFADALAGSLIAGALEAPILLSQQNVLTPVAAEAIDELGADRVIILGGEAAISSATEQQVRDRAGVNTVDRIDGLNRFDTARLIALAAAGDDGDDVGTTDQGRTAILATGERFPDALAAGPLAYSGGFPLLLTATAFLSQEAEAALLDLDIDFVFVAGGSNAVSDAVLTRLTELGIGFRRVAGPDRTFTAVEFAELTRDLVYEDRAATGTPLAVATGKNERGGADALTIAPLTARIEADLLITGGGEGLDGGVFGDISQPSTFINDNCAFFGNPPIIVAGGTLAISDEAVETLERAAACADFVPAGKLDLTPDEDVNEVGDTHVVDVFGENSLDEPAEGAVVRVEVYRAVEDGVMLEPDFDGSFYVEDDQVYVEVEDDRDNVQLDADGEATFSYSSDEEAEDRIIGCAIPNLTIDDVDEDSCTDEEGSLDGGPYGEDVVAKTWATGVFSGIPLSSAQEVGPDTADADDRIIGTATLATFASTNTICFDIEIDEDFGTDPGSFESAGAHLHEAPFGMAGPIVVTFDPVDDDTLRSDGCQAIDPTEFDVADLEADPADYYVNVHSEVFPGGATRGQVAFTAFDVPLESGQEVGDGTADESDDITGFAQIVAFAETNNICWSIEMTPPFGTDPGSFESAGAHLHEAPFGEAGPVVVAFDPVDDDTLRSDGCADAGGFDVTELEADPADYYVNVHSSVFPGGAARGQVAFE
jgi:putative cell wall-binding protein